jgi:RNA polymerase sigma-70 factor (ECF subfamily)
MSESSVLGEALGPIAMSPRRAEIGREGSEWPTIRAAQRGLPDALESLVRAHWAEARRIAAVILADDAAAEDVAQEALLAAVRSLDRFDRRRPFRPWLHRIVTNTALDWVRARQRRREVGLADASRPPNGLSAADSRSQSGISPELLAALKTLSAEQRAIVVLRHVAGFDSNEIAEMLDRPPATVRSMLQRALARLRGELEGKALTETGGLSDDG